MAFELPGTKTRIYRSSAVRQVDLLFLLWAIASTGAFLAMILSEAAPSTLAFLGRHPSGLAALVLLGTGLLLGVRLVLLRSDFRLVTDETEYFFLQAGDSFLLCRREDVLSFREEEAGLLLDTRQGPVRVEAPVQALILVENLLVRWASQEGRPHDPPHTPPFAR